MPLRLRTNSDRKSDMELDLEQLVRTYDSVPYPLQECGRNSQSTEDLLRRRELLSHIVAGRIPREEYVWELDMLGLKGKEFTGEDYVRALEDRLDLEIAVARSTSNNSRSDELGCVTYEPQSRRLTIEVPLRLSWWLFQYTLLHECGHVAAGHAFPIHNRGTREIWGWRSPPRRLARRQPINEGLPDAAIRDLSEEEAEQRARHALLTGALGQKALHTGCMSQLS